MDLKTYIATGDRGVAAKLASGIGVSPSYLSQMAAGASISPTRCVEIEIATQGKVTRRDLRPDDWERIWPELAQCKSAKRSRRSTDKKSP